MPTNVIMPALGMAQETGRVVKWLKHEGDAVVSGEPLLEIETDKVTVEVEAPSDGLLAAVTAEEGEDVPVGETIALVLAAGEALPEPTIAITPKTPRRPLASPKARRLASERGIEVAGIAGSGPGGAVLAADIESLAGNGHRVAERSPTWRRMAERTADSWRSVPHFYLRREVDATRLDSWRTVVRTRPSHERTSHTDLLVRITAEALRRHPAVNAIWQHNAPILQDEVNVGVAVAVPDGLVVPVVHGADRLTLAELTARRVAVVDSARAGRLRPEDVAGGTFTVSNLGMYGVDGFDAIVNTPQVAILAVGRIVERLVPIGGQPAVRPTMQLGVSFDHRAIDGAQGAQFLQTLAALVEEPAALIN